MNDILSILAWVALALAVIPAALTLANLAFYRRIPREAGAEQGAGAAGRPRVSVLIPARNEEENLGPTLAAVLANRGVEFEVVVLDDHSTDGTAALVSRLASADSRLRLESAPALPAGWCGKQHACHALSGLARHELLVFMDADVRLAPDALRRMAWWMERTGVALGSGVPRQEVVTLSERLLLPLIHFVLLGFLPMALMRWTRQVGASAGCGQLFITRAEAYRSMGGHARVRATLHDGVKLPRAFREAGLSTDLFDPTDLAVCRMYRTNGETWRGLGKNATEGLGAAGTIVPMTVMLLAGQVLPWLLLAWLGFGGGAAAGAPSADTSAVWVLSGVAAALSLFPRLLGVVRFGHPLDGALLHPLGVAALVWIQWAAWVRRWSGRGSEWKGRKYQPSLAAGGSGTGGA